MKKPMKILLTPEGRMVAVYSDALLPVADRLGEKTIDRASDVEWQDGAWEAKSRQTGEILAREPTRERALQLEVKAIESNLAAYA